MISPKNTIYFIIAMFIPFFLGLIFFMIYPIFQSVRNHSEEFVAIQKKILLIDQQNKEVVDFKKKYDTYKASLENLQTLFVNSQNPVDFIEFIEKTAKEEGISDLNTTIVSNPVTSKTAQAVLTFRVSFTANFSNIVRFVEKMEKGNYLARVRQLGIKQSKDGLSADMLFEVQ